MKCIIGLGNPGRDYAQSRHNIGWDAVSKIAKTWTTGPFKQEKKFHAEISEGLVGTEKILLVHPLTFMNRSGQTVAELQRFYHLPNEVLLVVQDEMDLPLGRLAFCVNGGPAGHNGIDSIQQALGHRLTPRLRLGIGRPTPPMTKENYVLQRFSPDEQALVVEVQQRASNAIDDWLILGLMAAMNRWNQTPSAK